jgi:mersacidin/lichenicidin family type 2 lantibiotic
MSMLTVVRAWTDAEYRRGLGAAERGRLPACPAGPAEPADAELRGAGGAAAVPPVSERPSCLLCTTLHQPCPSLMHFCPVPP